jgi:hypothetical protein
MDHEVAPYLGFEPLDELDNMRMIQLSQQTHFILDHLFIALDALLHNDLDSNLAGWAIGLSNDAVRTGAERATEVVFGPDTCKHTTQCSLHERTSSHSFQADRPGDESYLKL